MKVVAIRYTRDAAALVRFHEALGVEPGSASRPGRWVELDGDGGMVAVHVDEDADAGRCELAFESDGPLEPIAERVRAAGFEAGQVVDENFGRSLRVRDPDGVWVQINQFDRELYT
ncbi:hypothetical protein CFN78_27935 [Amycolatopsis antarctica]|uniref:VOC domain-containing protein n=1 Tax=Amycolatopsis antarctica TaxID=1854586 RepID=A0A263CVB2_9PSEU|nr:VOC family protein [Amycolatopsis antarctica]OZM69928.1 hypothetical protein CFN78_27935 [Amycolatopsis antarctica]